MKTLQYGSIILADEHTAEQVADEVITRDVYIIDSIPRHCTVIDVGGFYGEFTIACAMRGFRVLAFEPTIRNYLVLRKNLALNPQFVVEDFNVAVGAKDGISYIELNENHPAGSKFALIGDPVWTTTMETILKTQDGSFAVKLDCEGAEDEIFNDVGWLDRVEWLSMEWHNCDGDRYAGILRDNGFDVEMGCEGGNSGGIIHARRKA